MILRSLELKNFGKFSECTFEFRRGMNLVAGPNEAGKSTLMEAIPAVLFGLRDKNRFKPWGRQGSCEAALVLETGKSTVRIERDILTDRVLLTERDDLYHTLYSFEGKAAPQGRSSERFEYLEQIARICGIADDEVFRSSLFFGQGALEVSTSGSGLAGKLKAMLSGSQEVDYDRVLASLLDDYFAVTRENPWGKDKTKGRELEDVTARITELEKRWYEAQGALREIEGLRGQIAELDASLERDRLEHEKGERYIAWVRKQYQLEEKEEVLRKDFNRVSRQSEKVESLETRRRGLQEELKKTGLPRTIPEDLPKILADAEEVRGELVAVQGESTALREELLAFQSPPWKPAVLASLLLAGGGGGIGWYWSRWLVQGLLGAGLVISVIWLFYLVKAGRLRAERSRIKGQAQVLERQREEAQARLAALDERFERIGMSPSAVEIVKMQKSLPRHLELIKQLREVESALQVLEKAEELTEDHKSLTRELAVLDERLEKERPLRGSNVIPREELPEAEAKLEALGQSLKERERELLELTRREAALQGQLHDLQSIEEEGERLKERETALRRRKDALGTAYEVLSASVEEFRQTYLERLSADMGQHLGVATAGRYNQVQLDDDLSLSLKGRGGNSWQDLDCFSRGTVDAVYLAVRLALTGHLSAGKSFPLFLDDPLVNLDAGRLNRTLAALEQLSQEHQVIYLTHDERLIRRAAQKRWNVITLVESNRKPPVEAEDQGRDDVEQLYLL